MALTGMSLLAAILSEGDFSAFRRINAEWMQDEAEQEAHEFITDYLDRHRELPPVALLRREGHRLPRQVEEPLSYWVERAQRRYMSDRMREVIGDIAQALRNRDEDEALELILDASHNVPALVSGSGAFPEVDFETVLQNMRTRRNYGAVGLPTGYDLLDELTGGMMPGDLVVLVGRPSVGKSYILMHMIKTLLLLNDAPTILLNSRELSNEQLASRLVGMFAGVNPRLFRGTMSSHAEAIVQNVADEFGDLMRSRCRFMQNVGHMTPADFAMSAIQLGARVIAIDSAYLLDPRLQYGERINSKWERVSRTFEQLRDIALRLGVTIIVTSQMNRTQRRTSREEMDLASLASTDAIGQLADIVIGVQEVPGQRDMRLVQLIKNREGPVARFLINYAFTPPNFEFRELVHDEVRGSRRRRLRPDENNTAVILERMQRNE